MAKPDSNQTYYQKHRERILAQAAARRRENEPGPRQKPKYKPAPFKLRCEVCREKFYSDRHQRFCSRKCWRRSINLRPPVQRTCGICGSAFDWKGVGPTARKAYCSEACRRERARRTTREKRSKLLNGIRGTSNRTCEQCGNEFQCDPSSERFLCSIDCRRARRHPTPKARTMCGVAGCLNEAVYSSGLCNGCYCRLRRTGSLNRRVPTYRKKQTTGYIVVKAIGHPLARQSGLLFEHRKVLYDQIGDGPHKCYWCDGEVQWSNAGKSKRGSLVPDHLDGNKSNNSADNLVAACNTCNALRGLFVHWVMSHRNDRWLWKLYLEFTEKREVESPTGLPNATASASRTLSEPPTR